MDQADNNETLIYAFRYPNYCDDSYITDNETNLTTFDNSSNEEEILHKVSITICSIIFPFGIIGNGLVIWIAGFRMKKTTSAVWFLHLAIADFLSCAFFPVYITGWDGSCSLDFSWIFCSIDIILMNINLCTSVLLLTAMSIDRWVSVMWPFWAKIHRTRKLVRITAGIIWVLSFIWTGMMTFLLTNYISYISDRCNTELTIHLNRLVIMFVIPSLIIVTSYVTIFLKLRKSNRPQRSQRPYRIITAVILCFFICWAPYYIWPLTPMYYIRDVQYQIINTVVISLACLNSCINPIIYVIMGQDIRPGFLRSIPFRLESALGDHPDDPYEEQEDPEPTSTTDI